MTTARADRPACSPAQGPPISTDKGKDVACGTCGANLRLDADQAVAAAQLVTFIAAHSHPATSFTIRMDLDVSV